MTSTGSSSSSSYSSSQSTAQLPESGFVSTVLPLSTGTVGNYGAGSVSSWSQPSSGGMAVATSAYATPSAQAAAGQTTTVAGTAAGYSSSGVSYVQPTGGANAITGGMVPVQQSSMGISTTGGVAGSGVTSGGAGNSGITPVGVVTANGVTSTVQGSSGVTNVQATGPGSGGVAVTVQGPAGAVAQTIGSPVTGASASGTAAAGAGSGSTGGSAADNLGPLGAGAITTQATAFDSGECQWGSCGDSWCCCSTDNPASMDPQSWNHKHMKKM